MMLIFVIEGLASTDLVFDIIILVELIKGRHIGWFAISTFMMICPFLMGYGSMLTLRMNQIMG